jgi:serine/threonine protein kinase
MGRGSAHFRRPPGDPDHTPAQGPSDSDDTIVADPRTVPDAAPFSPSPLADSEDTASEDELTLPVASPRGVTTSDDAITIPGPPARATTQRLPPSHPSSPSAAPATTTPSGALASPHLTGLAPGTPLGRRYTIRRLLGRGGMGAVYLAHDAVLGKEVALKLLRPGLHEDETLAAFRTEVLLAQKVAHKNLCRTYDLEEIDGVFVIKMEAIDGETLAERLRRRGSLPVPEALAIAREIAAGLDAAHEQGVIHCDLKPQNVLLEHRTGRVVLTDFGVARTVARHSGTSERDLWGTPEYMAPEQLTTGEADPRSDVYSLGCVLYEVLTGQPPYVEKSALLVALAHLNTPIPDPRTTRPEIPPWLVEIMTRLLAKQPGDRYPSARQVHEAFNRQPSTDPTPAARPAPRPRRLVTALAAAAGAVLIAALGALASQLLHARRASWQPHIVDRVPSYVENADTPIVSPDGRWLAYISNRDASWRVYVEPLAGGPARALTPPRGLFYNLHWARDSQSLLAITWGWRAMRIPLDGRDAELVATAASNIEDCAGRLVIAVAGDACGENCTSRLVLQGPPDAPRDGKPAPDERELVRFPHPTQLEGMRCDAAGRRLVYAAALGEHAGLVVPRADLYLLDLAAASAGRASTPPQLTSDRLQNGRPVFHPDGRSLLFTSRRSGTFQIWELPLGPGGARTPEMITSVGPALAPDVSPDGWMLVYDVDSTAITLFAYELGGRRRLSHTFDDVSQPGVTADGREIVARLLRQGEARTYAVALSLQDGSERVLGEADAVALTTDGHEIIYAVNDPGERGGAVLYRRPIDADHRGAAQPVARLDDRAFEIHVDAAAAYVELGSTARPSTWRIPLGGGRPERIELPGVAKVIPAPVGGWRLLDPARDPEAVGQRWRLIGPGRAVDDPTAPRIEGSDPVWAPDGRSVLFWNGREIRRFHLQFGTEQILAPTAERPRGMALGRDGQTLYVAEFLGQVRRQVITNFKDRPRPE